MHRVHFTGQDLARTVVRVPEQPLSETLFALELLARNGGGEKFDSWRQRTTNRLSRRARSLLTLARTIRPVPDLLHMVESPAGAHSAPGKGIRPLDSRRQNIAGMLEEFHKVAIAPYWERIHACLEADCAARGRRVLSGGIEALLSTLHPSVRWRSGVLEIPGHRRYDVSPQGTGLLLAPSLFLVDGPVLIAGADENRPPVLAYPVAVDPASSPLSSVLVPRSGADSLGPLVGRTRAAIMKSLTDACTTTELGRRIGISAASASQHTNVLRSAGLITTQRRLNTALHSLTPLGAALLDGHQRPHIPHLQLTATS
ncbi:MULTISPECIES: winged helix-turn-helix domain-containing protein [Streptomyces]|uniref:Transcriptional regulator n=2 Tax=Streptomyces cacaoi TaxID=1898 RepID=A0A4Y3R4Z4_STRCI|nr:MULTISPECIES: winged helix-turn-helix domain-containing protein [Streptomyces]NNG85971.1 winged helix-turn-helix transcriptional regulator [Streptomyces cacaoi]QHF93431.1 ArsR family transcriptional regulator [Streptomyces sp. NHF165]GEB51020.1 transcriptional regulator [Streptomyces cacaoi]